MRVREWPGYDDSEVPAPVLVAAWVTLDLLPLERIPRWAAHWIATGHDGAALAELAGLSGDKSEGDAGEIRALLPAALADCGAPVPGEDAAAATVAFTNLARLCVTGRATEQWVVEQVDDILLRCGPLPDVLALPLGRLHGVFDEWFAPGERAVAAARRKAEIRAACAEQLRLSGGLPVTGGG